MAKSAHNPHAKYKWQWRCIRHGMIAHTRAGAAAHSATSSGKCRIKKEQVRVR